MSCGITPPNVWQDYSELRQLLNKHDLVDSRFEFCMYNQNEVSGKLSQVIFDKENLFIKLKDVCINRDHFRETILIGFDIARWRCTQLVQPKPTVTDDIAAVRRRRLRPATSIEPSRLLIDNTVRHGKTNGDGLAARLSEIDLAEDDDPLMIDLSLLQLPASNEFEVVRLKPSYGSDDLDQYLLRCHKIADLLSHEPVIGLAMFPLNDEMEFIVSYKKKLSAANRELFLLNLETDIAYLCFATGHANYIFCFNFSGSDDHIVHKAMQILKPVLESRDTQKASYRCAVMSGVLWHRFQIKLSNVCDLQLVDQHIQRLHNMFRYGSGGRGPFKHYLIQMVRHYLKITLSPLPEVRSWHRFSNRVTNTIRFNLVFLRELSTRMVYELLNYPMAYSTRGAISFRAASPAELATMARMPERELYKTMLGQPLYDHEKTFACVNMVPKWPLRLYDYQQFVGDFPTPNGHTNPPDNTTNGHMSPT